MKYVKNVVLSILLLLLFVVASDPLFHYLEGRSALEILLLGMAGGCVLGLFLGLRVDSLAVTGVEFLALLVVSVVMAQIAQHDGRSLWLLYIVLSSVAGYFLGKGLRSFVVPDPEAEEPAAGREG